MRTRKVFVAIAVALTAIATSCGSSSSGSGGGGPSGGSVGGADKVLRTAFNEDVGNIDPDNNFEVEGLGMIEAMYQGLLQYAPGTNHIEGLLAKSWTASADAKTFTFQLRTGVKFHDGSTMTSANVKQSFERRVHNQDFFTGYFLGDVKSIQTPNPSTITVTLNHSNYGFLDSLCSPWGPKVIGPQAFTPAHVDGKDASKTWLSKHEDGTGPYVLTTYDRGNEYSLRRFADYWGPKPYFNGYDIKIIPSLEQEILQLRAGQLDFVDQYPFQQLGQVPAPLKVLSWNTLGMELAIVNTHRITNQAERQKIAAAINPQSWISQAYSGYATPALSNYAKTMLTPTTPWTYPQLSSFKSVHVPALTVAYASDDISLQSQAADEIIAKLQAAGISASARVMPTAQFDNTAQAPAKAPDIMLVHFYPDDAFPGSLAYLVFQCGTPLNYLGYCNKQADTLFNAGFTNPSAAGRSQQFLQGAKLGFDAGSFLGLADLKDVIVYRPGLANLVTYPVLPWNFNYALATASS